MTKSSETKKEYAARYRKENREKILESGRQRRRVCREKVFAHYGNVCNYCGFDDPRALCIDHINDNGAEERRGHGDRTFAGWRFYEYLVKQGYPEGYQTLCANCNMIKELSKHASLAQLARASHL